MKKRLSIVDFTFTPSGHGAYVVSYEYPSGKTISARITDLEYIDETKNEAEPTQAALERLKNAIKFFA